MIIAFFMKNLKKIHIYIYMNVSYLNKVESPSPNDAPCQKSMYFRPAVHKKKIFKGFCYINL